MKKEITCAVNLLKTFCRNNSADVAEDVDVFCNSLFISIEKKFQGHWYPLEPNRGNGFRCLRSAPGKPDSTMQKVAVELKALHILKLLPSEITIWIDPGEVFYRIGEQVI